MRSVWEGNKNVADEVEVVRESKPEFSSVVVDLSMSGALMLDCLIGFGKRSLTLVINFKDFEIALLRSEVVRLERETTDLLLKSLGGSGGRSGALMSRDNG